MKNDITSKTKFHFKKNITNEDRIKNETMESCDTIKFIKKSIIVRSE